MYVKINILKVVLIKLFYLNYEKLWWENNSKIVFFKYNKIVELTNDYI